MSERLIQLKDLMGTTVLVVDDSAGMRQLLASVLASLGVGRVLVAQDGREALDQLRAQHIEAIVVDWEMRPMDGLTLIREVRRVSNFQFALTPIVMVTAHSHPHIVRAALNHGANQFLTKPVVPQTLLNRLLWALNDRRPFVNRDGFFVHETAGPGKSAAATKASATVAQKPEAAGEPMWEIE